MCNFIDDIPLKSKTAETGNSNKYLELFFKPTPADQYYRFRLIGITTKNRDNPFIEKYIHEVWTTNSEGRREIADSITCPRTKYIGKQECAVCKHTDHLWVACKNSKWTDKLSQKKKRELQRKYRAHLLVYVVNDPNYSGNNGKLKVITFTDQNEFKAFYDKAKTARREGVKIFNGGNAVDFWVRVNKVEEVWNEGQPNEGRRSVTKITDMGFSTKPYPIPTITPALVDGFPFDSEFFTTSTEAEVIAFYNKYCTGIGVNVPTDDIIPTSTKSAPKTPAAKEIKQHSKSAAPVVEESSDDVDLDNIIADDDDEDLPDLTLPKDSDNNSNYDIEDAGDTFDLDDLDDLLAGIK